MARQFLTRLLVATLPLVSTALGADGIAYRNGKVLAVDAEHRMLSADLGDGAQWLSVDERLGLASLHPGDSVLLGLRPHAEGGPQVLYLQRSVAAADPAMPVALPPSDTSGVRRPMMVVPNPRPRGSSVPALAVAVDPGGPAAVVPASQEVPRYTVTGPAAPENQSDGDGKTKATLREESETAPSRVDGLRTEGTTELERDLSAVEPLAREADVAWSIHLATCPTAEAAGTRGWLSLRSDLSVPTTPCGASRQRVAAIAAQVRDGLRAAEDHARATWVTPGALRDALGRHGFVEGH
jgi:hypothetical protein